MSSFSVPRKIFNAFASIKTALSLLLLIAIACIVGSLGYTFVYSAWWFIAMLFLLAMSLSACTYRRFSLLLRKKGALHYSEWGSLLVHVSILLILAGAVVRGVWGQKGYVTLSNGQMAGFMMLESGGTKGLPFDIHLKEFVVERHAPSADIPPPQEVLVAFNRTREPVSQVPVELNGDQYVVGSVSGKEVYTRILRREPDFSVNMETREVISRSEELNNPALLLEMSTESVTNKIWVFANHPGMPMLASGKPTDETSAFVMVYDLHYTSDPRGKIKEFRSSLQIMEHGVSVAEKTIVVNSPMKYKGYSIYQSGYDKDRESWSQLQIVKDPGVPLVYTGFVLMLAGLSMVFYLKPLKTGK